MSYEVACRSILVSDKEEIINLEKSLINAIVEAREESGLTQKQLSELCGVKQPVICRPNGILKRIPNKIDQRFDGVDIMAYIPYNSK